MCDNSHSLMLQLFIRKAKVDKNKFNVFEIKSQGRAFVLKNF